MKVVMPKSTPDIVGVPWAKDLSWFQIFTNTLLRKPLVLSCRSHRLSWERVAALPVKRMRPRRLRPPGSIFVTSLPKFNLQCSKLASVGAYCSLWRSPQAYRSIVCHARCGAAAEAVVRKAILYVLPC